MPTRHISRFLHRNHRLHPILARIDNDRRLLEAVRTAVPDGLKEHCVHAAVQGDALILFTTSPVWATRLRFAAPDLIQSIPGLSPDTRLTVRIATGSNIPRPGPHPPKASRLSPETRHHLLQAADGLADADLAAALRRLAHGHTQSSE